MHGFCDILLVTLPGDFSPVRVFCLLLSQQQNRNYHEGYVHHCVEVIQNCGEKQDFLGCCECLFFAAFLFALYPFSHCLHLLAFTVILLYHVRDNLSIAFHIFVI